MWQNCRWSIDQFDAKLPEKKYGETSKIIWFDAYSMNCCWRPFRIYFIQDTGKGQLSEKAYLKRIRRRGHSDTKIITYQVKFNVEPDFGIPGAFLIKNEHKHKFFLQSATLEVPAHRSIQFNCKSWVYPFAKTKTNRLFFFNTVSIHSGRIWVLGRIILSVRKK